MSNGQIEWMSNTGYLSQGGWTYSVPMLSYFSGSATYNTRGYPPQSITCYYQTAFLFQDPSAGRHALGIALANDPSPAECINAGVPTNALTSEPGFDDFFVATLSNSTVTVSDHDGTVYQFPFPGSHSLNSSPIVYALPSFIEDRNGNKAIVTDSGNGTFGVTDTLGRTEISTSGFGNTGNTVSVSGLPNPYVVNWGTASFNFSAGSELLDPQDQQCPASIPNDAGSLPVITQITLPNGQSYQLQYEGTYGLLQKIIYPNGGYVEYVWGENPLSKLGLMADTSTNPNPTGCQYEYASPVVTHRYVSFDGQHIALEQDFNYTTNWSSTGWTTKSTTVITHDFMRPGQPSFTTVYTYAPFNVQPAPDTMSTVFAAQIPLEQTTEYYDWSGALLKTVNKTWGDQNTLVREQTALATGLTSEKDYSYNCGIIEAPSVAEYDFGQGIRGPLLRNTVMKCATLAAIPLGAQIEDRPSSIVTYDGSGNRAAETDYGYDQTSVTGTSNVVGHDYANYNSSYNNRGNATSKTEWLNTGGASPVTHYTYDDTGQMLSMTDPNGNNATYSYVDHYASGSPPGPTNAYLTQITYPNTGVGHVESFSYYYDDGQLASSTDQNGKPATYSYTDSLDRLT